MTVTTPKTQVVRPPSQRDEAAFEATFLEHYPRIFGVLFRLVGDRARAETQGVGDAPLQQVLHFLSPASADRFRSASCRDDHASPALEQHLHATRSAPDAECKEMMQ